MGRSWLWRGAIRNPTGCPAESVGRAARQPSVTSLALLRTARPPAPSGTLLALARCDPEPHRLPGRVGESSRASAFSPRTESIRERRAESSRLSSEASAYRTSPASPRAGLERAQDPHPSLRCKWRHAAAEAVSRRQRTMITSHPSGESRPGTGLLPVRITHDSGLHSFIPFLSFMLDYLAPFVLI